MTTTRRRTVLAMAVLGLPHFMTASAATEATEATEADDRYGSNTELYADHDLAEGVDYARRHRRHAAFDDSLAGRSGFGRTAVVAPHGGGIEVGTSELCLAAAGYHPATLVMTSAGGTTHDYWMFEGLRPADNAELHVTATHCDDVVARSLCAGALNALGLHGCTPGQAGLETGAAAVLVGGRNDTFRQYLLQAYAAAGVRAIDAATRESLNGTDPANIVNRTMLGMGAQLEITTPMREAMFEVNTRAQRKHTTTPAFWTFVTATRAAVARMESDQPIP